MLADELNRAPPRTQSALLEGMAQGQVSLDGTTYPLPRPFTVVATQNPLDSHGHLSAAGLAAGSLPHAAVAGAPVPRGRGAAAHHARPDASGARRWSPSPAPEELRGLRTLAAELRLDEAVAEYVVRLARATREHGDIERGASTRAVLAVGSAAGRTRCGRARDFVTPGDIRAVLVPCLAHRLLLRSNVQGAAARDEAAHLLEEISRKVAAPR